MGEQISLDIRDEGDNYEVYEGVVFVASFVNRCDANEYVTAVRAYSGVPSEKLSPGIVAEMMRRDELMREMREALKATDAAIEDCRVRVGFPTHGIADLYGRVRAVLAKLEAKP